MLNALLSNLPPYTSFFGALTMFHLKRLFFYLSTFIFTLKKEIFDSPRHTFLRFKLFSYYLIRKYRYILVFPIKRCFSFYRLYFLTTQMYIVLILKLLLLFLHNSCFCLYKLYFIYMW